METDNFAPRRRRVAPVSDPPLGDGNLQIQPFRKTYIVSLRPALRGWKRICLNNGIVSPKSPTRLEGMETDFNPL